MKKSKLKIEATLVQAEVEANGHIYSKKELGMITEQLKGKTVTVHKGYGQIRKIGNKSIRTKSPVIGIATVSMHEDFLIMQAKVNKSFRGKINVGDSIGPFFDGEVEKREDKNYVRSAKLVSIHWLEKTGMSQECMKVTKVD